MKNVNGNKQADKLFSGYPAMEAAVMGTAALNEKLAATALSAAEDGIKLTAEWSRDTIAGLGKLAKPVSDPSDYAREVAAVATESAAKAVKRSTDFVEIASRVQSETVRLMTEAGNEFLAESPATAKAAQ
ncbi:MAG: phasin family protein [Rhodobacteraceae bacterium]|nr:phasin family protein [Paracoccaceae bacterium]